MNANNIHGINQGNGLPQISCVEYVQKFLRTIPLFVKSVMFTTLLIYILNFFLPIIAAVLVNIPYATILRFHLWRLFTTVYVTTSILNIIFAFIFWIKDAMALEMGTSTLRYMFIFLINSIMIQIIYTTIMLIAYLLIRNDSVLLMNAQGGAVENNGLWPIIMAELTLLCMANPESTMHLFLFPCGIKAKYYPFCLLIFFTVMGGGIQFDVFSGVIYGVLYHYVLKNRFIISDSFIQKCEGCFLFKWLKNIPGFVSISQCNNGLPMIIIQSPSLSGSSSGNNNNSTTTTDPPKSGFSSFSGKGTTLGGSYGTSSGEYQGVSQNNHV